MLVNVIGMGYIGLPTALMLASHGVRVIGTDTNKERITALRSQRKAFEEEGLDALFSKALSNGITFSTEYSEADIYIISVPTPYIKETQKIDPGYVISAVKSALEVCPEGGIIVIESTISPGTIDRYVRPLIGDRNIRIAHAPERIIPGNMLYELEHNPRTIGADDPETGEMIKALYASFCKGEIVLTDVRTAEMSKVVENTYRDINIAFANELAKICRAADMDVYEVIRIANRHPRVNILTPGPGVGGHCISVDPWFLVGDYPDLAQLIHTARDVNDSMPAFVLSKIRSIMEEKGITDPARVGLYGLTYKENVDDTRESPTLQLLELPGTESFRVYDPFVKNDLVPNQLHDFSKFLDAVDLVVIMVGHSEIRADLSRLEGKWVLDTRHISEQDGFYRL